MGLDVLRRTSRPLECFCYSFRRRGSAPVLPTRALAQAAQVNRGLLLFDVYAALGWPSSKELRVCRWAKGLGAFINLESTGASGPDVLFQHTGAWTLRAYARAAKHPHGSCLAQVPVAGTGSSKVTKGGMD